MLCRANLKDYRAKTKDQRKKRQVRIYNYSKRASQDVLYVGYELNLEGGFKAA